MVVELAAGLVTRISKDGTKSTVVDLGGGPNGAAIGPDGRLYVCNNGGHTSTVDATGKLSVGGPSSDYQGGRIDVVDLTTGASEVLYSSCGDHGLTAPNDIIFDREGGFWFSDMGKGHQRHTMRGGLYYAAADGSFISEAAFPLNRPNGVALSPEEDRLYVAETDTCRVWAFDIVGQGKLKSGGKHPYDGASCIMSLPGYRMLDSMAVDSEGNICVAARVQGSIAVGSPDGKSIREVPVPGAHPTNICFGGADMKTAFITLLDGGQLIATQWHCAGHAPNFFDRAPDIKQA